MGILGLAAGHKCRWRLQEPLGWVLRLGTHMLAVGLVTVFCVDWLKGSETSLDFKFVFEG